MSKGVSNNIAKYWWLQSIACSEASMTNQMRGFGLDASAYEQALHAFSGGFMHRGLACGLLTGGALSAGFLARKRFEDDETRATAALYATIKLTKAYQKFAGSVNCQEIIGLSLSKLIGRLRYLQQGKGSMCGRLHLKWAPQAHELIDKALTGFNEYDQAKGHANCAVQALRKMVSSVGMKIEDSVFVAGLAGGVGFLGNVCGALASGVYALSISRYLSYEEKKRDSQIRGALQELTGASYRGQATQLRLKFIERFGSELCFQIVHQHFKNIAQHSAFVEHGGCREVIEFIANWVVH